MIDQIVIDDEDVNPDLVVTSAERLSYNYEMLISTLERKQRASLLVFSVLIGVFFWVMIVYTIGVTEIGEFTVIAEFLPSIQVIIMFLACAVLRYLFTLYAMIGEARMAYDRLRQASQLAAIVQKRGNAAP